MGREAQVMDRWRNKFPFILWWYTNGDEDLFQLDAEQRLYFQLLVNEAERMTNDP